VNIKITHNWLLDYLDTDATPQEIQKYLSLCGPSIESVTKMADSTPLKLRGTNDYVYDIEITSNRVDIASVFGIAQEALAILPYFGKKARLKVNPLEKYKFNFLKKSSDRNKNLDIKIKSDNLCSRFTAIVLENVKISKPPDFVRERLQFCGIKSINNVIDISNYLMLAFGQPVHIFDYDSIGKATMIMRESKEGEKIVTLDGKQIVLPGGDIVIEDGNKRLIDLCGIMGGSNSAVNDKTNNIIFFVQTYNPKKIRRASMTTGQRTVAATYFEKGLDEERVEPTTVYGVELLEKYAGAKIASQIYDIYPNPYKSKSLTVSITDIQRIIGVQVSKDKIIKILSNLGFNNHVDHGRDELVTVQIPSYRSRDVLIKEDLIEEIARIYGYHNLPNNIQSSVYIKQPKEAELMFNLQSKIKYFLKHLGLNEVMNYSMISEKMIKKSDLIIEDHLAIKNSISEEIKFMRTHIFPSLIMNIKNNEGKADVLKFFEIAKSYIPKKGNLPIEKYQLAIVVNTNIDDLKGIIDSLFTELKIEKYKISQSKFLIFEKGLQAEITIDKDWIGKFGQLNYLIKDRFGLKNNVYLASFELEVLMKYYLPIGIYKAINPFAQIKLDLTLAQNKNQPYSLIKELAFKTSYLLEKIELIDTFKNKITLRFYFSSNRKNITEQEAKIELEKIQSKLL